MDDEPWPELVNEGFSHVGIVVESLDRFRSSWGRLMGATDWRIAEPSDTGHHVQLWGKDLERPSASRIGFTRVGGLPIEVIEPHGPDSASGWWLREHGPGVSHLAFWVNDLASVLASVSGVVRVAYGPGSVPVTALVSAPIPRCDLPWSFLAPVDGDGAVLLELLDVKFAAGYREAFGDHVFFPGQAESAARGGLGHLT